MNFTWGLGLEQMGSVISVLRFSLIQSFWVIDCCYIFVEVLLNVVSMYHNYRMVFRLFIVRPKYT